MEEFKLERIGRDVDRGQLSLYVILQAIQARTEGMAQMQQVQSNRYKSSQDCVEACFFKSYREVR